MNPKNVLSLRWRTPRALALAGLMALVIVVTALALTQTSTVAAPPPPLRGPFRFIELPDEMSAKIASNDIQWTPFYTETFSDNSFLTTWTLSTTPGMDTHTWARVVNATAYPTDALTDTLWSVAYPGPNLPVDYTVHAGDTYSKNMETWAILKLDPQQYAHFRVSFDYWVDTQPGATFGWAFSCDGTDFYGKVETYSHVRQWTPMKGVELVNCPGQLSMPGYFAFLFRSSDTETPVGLGAFVDNVVVSGTPWNKVYMPVVRRDPTPIASPTPTTQPFPLTQSYDFESLGKWCSTSNDSWTSGIVSLGGSNAYYLAMKQSSYLWALSPRDSSADNFRITADFNLLRMNSSRSLSDYGGAKFGLLFTVKGNPFDPADPCYYNGGQAESGIGYYRFIVKIKEDGSGYKTLLTRWENGVEPEQNGNFVDLPAGVTINRTGWNTMRIDRYGANIKAYINDTLVQNWDNSNSGTGGWFGLFTETTGNNPSSWFFESDWDNIKVYNLNP